MPQDRTYVYEGLFLFPQSAASDLQGSADHVLELLNRAAAEIISFRKWDERRLAYEIMGNKRGLFFLAYFKARGSAMPGLERDCNLSERLLRAMITRADHLPAEVIEAAEGRQQLADEARLRATQPAGAQVEASTAAAEPETEDDYVEEEDEV